MAITITKEPTAAYYPAFNDSYLQFTSNRASDYKAIVRVMGEGGGYYINAVEFTIYPDTTGKYSFNMKEPAKIRLNPDGFQDYYDETATLASVSDFGESIYGTTKRIYLEIEDYNSNGNDSVTVSYNFYRGVKQIGDSISSVQTQILNVPDALIGNTYYLTYFEGYPFAVDIMEALTTDEIYVKNLGTGTQSTNLLTILTSAFRLYIDSVTDNWTTGGFLPLTETVNSLEIHIDQNTATSNPTKSAETPTIIYTNLILKKVPSKCGIYLKWYNGSGYSYFLFDEFNKTTLSTKSLSRIAVNAFNNVEDGLASDSRVVGKTGNQKMKLTTFVDEKEIRVLNTLFYSPSVQMWNKTTPFTEGEWVDVEVSNKFETQNKERLNKISLTVTLPDLITARL